MKTTAAMRVGSVVRWAPLIALPLMAALARDVFSPWVFMWVVAFALFAGCKWLTLHTALAAAREPGAGRIIAYLLGWPGMDAANFLDALRRGSPVSWARVGATMGNIALGLGFLFAAGPVHEAGHLLIAGWMGMAGIVFMLHFGLFHSLSIAWNLAGVGADPIMRSPIAAKSLADFWGRRWNGAFHELVHRFCFRRICRETGARTAIVAVFGLSGVVHELVISVPARGGYGLPTAYFLIQGFGLLASRSRIGARFGLTEGVRGWLFTFVLAAGPACLLFHPPFVRRVILPMLEALHLL